MLDVAASADAVLAREPGCTRERLAACFGLNWAEARPWVLLLVACHDLGKACPGFQCKWKNLTVLDAGPTPNTEINHAFVSQIEVSRFLGDLGWPEDLAELAADAIGCHHGQRASPNTLERLAGDRRELGKAPWAEARRELFQAVREVLAPVVVPVKSTLSGPDFNCDCY